MSPLTIALFGKFCVWHDGQPVKGIEARKARELFSYLLLNRSRPHARETLACILSADAPPSQQKKGLRQALWQLQAALDPLMEAAHGRVLLVEPDWIHINPHVDIQLDVASFARGYEALGSVATQALSEQQVQLLDQTVELYHGNLLEDCYEDWCLYERERLQNMYMSLLDKLVDFSEANRAYQKGLAYAEILLRYDYARERTHRRLMRLHYLAGDRTAALRQFERCAAALSKELDVRPSERTLALYEDIKRDQLKTPAAGPLPSPRNTAAMPDLLTHLRELQAHLTHLQRHVEQKLQVLEQAAGSPPAPGQHSPE